MGVRMKALHRTFSFLLLSSFALAAAAAADYRLSGPYTHDNATLFLVHRATAAPSGTRSRKYIPLQQALEQKKVVVHETGNVNELAIENLSPDSDVFIQGGDIVKGGQQDRVFATDLILPPKSGRTKIQSFCVEQGRWTRRGREDARSFSASSQAIVGKDAKLAIKGSSRSQGDVWKSVAKVQEKLGRSLGMNAAVAAPASPTSLQLSLENRRVTETAGQFAAALKQSAAPGLADAAGYVIAINGEFQGADIYASPELFRALWPKHVQSLAVEAITEKAATPSPRRAAPTSEAALAFLTAAERTAAPASETPPNRRTSVVKKESPKTLLVESHDTATRAWVHRNVVAK